MELVPWPQSPATCHSLHVVHGRVSWVGMFDVVDKPTPPRSLNYGKPKKGSKLVIVSVTKKTDDDKMGFHIDAFETEMAQKRHVVVRDVVDGMEAKRVGLRRNDVLQSVNGHKVSSPNGAIELYRRAQWALLRVEWEQIKRTSIELAAAAAANHTDSQVESLRAKLLENQHKMESRYIVG